MKYISALWVIQQHSNIELQSLTEEIFNHTLDTAFESDSELAIEKRTFKQSEVALQSIGYDFDKFIHYNILIFEDKDLLNFVENGVVVNSYLLNRLVNLFMENQGMEEYLVPYLPESVDYAIAEALSKCDYYTAESLIQFANKYELVNKGDCFYNVTQFVDEATSFFKGLDPYNYINVLTKLTPWRSYQWNRVITALPPSFDFKRNQLAEEMYGFIVSIYQIDPDVTEEINRYLCQVRGLREGLAKDIEDLSDLTYQLNQADAGAEESENSPWRIGLSLLVAVIALFKLMVTCSR